MEEKEIEVNKPSRDGVQRGLKNDSLSDSSQRIEEVTLRFSYSRGSVDDSIVQIG